ncbi:hypothetical protein Pmani_029089 [Petrolisthes manimaculis]|uniref:Uncharacterized protein n=1 Tax=Petrolisthes manimaculis TaxID=1843537 RepID=A0AAE1P098_9EUCA|nr:hypothetical protein Pmani_029089 [Petrolisthes manimaculis]
MSGDGVMSHYYKPDTRVHWVIEGNSGHISLLFPNYYCSSPKYHLHHLHHHNQPSTPAQPPTRSPPPPTPPQPPTSSQPPTRSPPPPARKQPSTSSPIRPQPPTLPPSRPQPTTYTTTNQPTNQRTRYLPSLCSSAFFPLSPWGEEKGRRACGRGG